MVYVRKEAVEKSCAYCKGLFMTSRSKQRFCSDEHRLEFIRRVNELAQCPHCGGELL